MLQATEALTAVLQVATLLVMVTAAVVALVTELALVVMVQQVPLFWVMQYRPVQLLLFHLALARSLWAGLQVSPL